MNLTYALLNQLGISLRLHARNKMALLYSYLFPTIFLVAFWVLYRFEQVPLVRHVGELLTVTALGGACFGLPTTMVSERERGVWRRYRLTPVSTATLVAGTVAARYLLLVVAGLLQLVLAMGLGMPLPRHPFELFLAFTFVAFAFIGLGLVIAMMADNVPAVQALGQCIFLPMLIIGGVAVPLASLPDWAQTSVGVLSRPLRRRGAAGVRHRQRAGRRRFSLLALVLIGAAGCLAGAKMFRWDAEQRFAAAPGKAGSPWRSRRGSPSASWPSPNGRPRWLARRARQVPATSGPDGPARAASPAAPVRQTLEPQAQPAADAVAPAAGYRTAPQPAPAPHLRLRPPVAAPTARKPHRQPGSSTRHPRTAAAAPPPDPGADAGHEPAGDRGATSRWRTSIAT